MIIYLKYDLAINIITRCLICISDIQIVILFCINKQRKCFI